jgi:hypothetical protein
MFPLFALLRWLSATIICPRFGFPRASGIRRPLCGYTSLAKLLCKNFDG